MRVRSNFLFGIALFIYATIYSDLFSVDGSKRVVHIRTCQPYTPRHITLAVGPDPSTSMIVTFASTQSNQGPAPYAGVFVSKNRTSIENLFLQHITTTNQDSDVEQPVLLYLENSSDDSPTFYNVRVDAAEFANDGKKGGKRRTYHSPYYHHITITGLEPGMFYFYKLVYHTKFQSYTPYSKYLIENSLNVRQQPSSGTVQEIKEAEAKLKESVKSDDDNESDRSLRKLIEWGPYDPSHHNCPDPNKIRSFRTAPRYVHDATSQQPVNIAVIGDIGQFPHSQETAKHLHNSRQDIDTLLLVGDLAYNEYDPRQWDSFLDFLDDYPISHTKPMQLVPGNHDIDKLANDNNIFLAYEHRFRMPRMKPPQLGQYNGPEIGHLNMDIPPYPLPYEWGNGFYAYTYGPARILMINAYASVEPDSTQYKWILSELEAVDRTISPWVLAVLHTPMYNTFGIHHHDLQIKACKEHLENLLINHNVNLVFTGHIHAYLRTKNVVNGTPNASGPMHITVGAGGRNCEAPFTAVEPEPWVAVRDATVYGYGMFRIFNSSHAEWEWIHTGQSEKHHVNELYHSNITLPAGPSVDRIIIENQYLRR